MPFCTFIYVVKGMKVVFIVVLETDVHDYNNWKQIDWLF